MRKQLTRVRSKVKLMQLMTASLGIYKMKKLVKIMKEGNIKLMIMRLRNVPGQIKVSLRLTRNFGQT